MMKLMLVYPALLLLAQPALGQLLPAKPLQQTLSPLTEPLKPHTERLQQLTQQQVLQLAEKAALPDPLTVLPKTLQVLGTSGQPHWREVEVEHGFRAVERQWLLLVSDNEWQQLTTRWPQLSGYLQQREELSALGLQLITLQVPAELDSSAALAQQFNAELAAIAGRNHLYQPQSDTSTEATTPQPAIPMCSSAVTLGMVDTAIALDHPALQQQPGQLHIVQQNFLPADIATSYSHGTAVAGVLAAQQADSLPLLPQLTLYSASAFYPSNAYQQSATLAHILQALNWLASQQITVINMSLTGPDNPVLAATVAKLTENNVLLIAAAGNGGPAAAPLYPAAYEQVIAATAVDQQGQLYRWANQGAYIDFAALGVKVPTLTADGRLLPQSGTSMATPVVSAAAACLHARYPGITPLQIKQLLMQQARDVGEPGKDDQFGYGVIAAPLKTQL